MQNKTPKISIVLPCYRSEAFVGRMIETRGYAKPFAADRRRVTKVGVNFLADGLGIDRWEAV